jgi:hypothetical protein
MTYNKYMEDIKQMLEIPTKEQIISKWQQEVKGFALTEEYCKFCALVEEDCICPLEDRYDEDGIASYE